MYNIDVEEDMWLKSNSRTDKKENQIFLIYKEIQNGAAATSFMTKGFLIYI